MVIVLEIFASSLDQVPCLGTSFFNYHKFFATKKIIEWGDMMFHPVFVFFPLL
jgi:hypothetical protein